MKKILAVIFIIFLHCSMFAAKEYTAKTKGHKGRNFIEIAFHKAIDLREKPDPEQKGGNKYIRQRGQNKFLAGIIYDAIKLEYSK